MSTVTILGAPQSNFVRVVRMLCHEKGIGYDLVPLRPQTPEVKAITPTGKIPAFRHGDVTIAETMAICGYIEQVFPGPTFTPADPVAAAAVTMWVSVVATHVDQVLLRQYFAAYRFPGTPDGAPDRARIDALVPKCAAVFAMLEKELSAHDYLGSGHFSLADMFAYPILSYMPRMPETAELLKASPHVQAWLDRIEVRPSAAATIPPPFPPS